MSPPITAVGVCRIRPLFMMPTDSNSPDSFSASSSCTTWPVSLSRLRQAIVRIRYEVKNGTTTSPSSSVRYSAAPEGDHVRQRVPDQDREDRRRSGVQERPLELRSEVGERVAVVAEVPVEVGVDGKPARQRRQRQPQQRDEWGQVEQGEPHGTRFEQPVRRDPTTRLGAAHHGGCDQPYDRRQHQRQGDDRDRAGEPSGADRHQQDAGADERAEADEFGSLHLHVGVQPRRVGHGRRSGADDLGERGVVLGLDVLRQRGEAAGGVERGIVGEDQLVVGQIRVDLLDLGANALDR